jgi:hypothetical protein
MDREKILSTLRALAAKRVENGCTEAEAMAAATMLARMLDRHGLSQADLKESVRSERIGEAKWKSPARDHKLGALNSVAGAVASYCDCKVWISCRGTQDEAATFFGLEPDTMLATFLMDSFYSAMMAEWHEYRTRRGAVIVNGRPKALVSAKDQKTFEVGMMSRIYWRLADMKKARNAEVDQSSGRTGNALVVVKSAAVEEAYGKLGVKLKNARQGRTTIRNMDAYRAGSDAGDRVNITTGIGASA